MRCEVCGRASENIFPVSYMNKDEGQVRAQGCITCATLIGYAAGAKVKQIRDSELSKFWRDQGGRDAT